VRQKANSDQLKYGDTRSTLLPTDRVVARGPPGREKHSEGMQESSRALSPAIPRDDGAQSIRTLKGVQERQIA
jgi:hypothetical protein